MRQRNLIENILGLLIPLLAGAALGALLHKVSPGMYSFSAIPGLAVWTTMLYWTCLALGGRWYPLLGHDYRFLDKLNHRLQSQELRVVYVTPSLLLRHKKYELLDTNGRSVRRKMSWEDVRALGKQSSKGTRAV